MASYGFQWTGQVNEPEPREFTSSVACTGVRSKGNYGFNQFRGGLEGMITKPSEISEYVPMQRRPSANAATGNFTSTSSSKPLANNSSTGRGTRPNANTKNENINTNSTTLDVSLGGVSQSQSGGLSGA